MTSHAPACAGSTLLQSAIHNPQSAIIRSEYAVCCWVPHFALRLEEARRPELAGRPAALLTPDTSRRLWQVAPLARRAGVRPGMTVSQAIGLCSTLRLCEPDPVFYEERFAALLVALGHVSPAVEPVELGRAFVGTDGLERLWGGVESIVEAIICGMRNEEKCGIWNAECGIAGQMSVEESKRLGSTLLDSAFRIPLSAFDPIPHSAFRLGWGKGKFIAWTAATRARPGECVYVKPGEEGTFLAAQPLAALPVEADMHRRLRQLGLRTLGDLAALPEDAVAAQFGDAGRRVWRLAAGRTVEAVTGRPAPEPVVALLTFYTPVADRALLARALDRLLERALRSPRRVGWRVQTARLRAELERGGSWSTEVTYKDPTAARERLAAPLLVRWDQAPPAGAVERLIVEFTAFAPGTTELQLFARDASAAARAGRRRALRAAAREILLRLRRPMLYRVIELEPWSRIPERRYALIDFEA